jgi:hypothetical protein
MVYFKTRAIEAHVSRSNVRKCVILETEKTGFYINI